MKNESVDGICKLAVPEKSIYNVSNHIFYNYGSGPGGVLVQDDKKQNTTIASGYYLITGLPDGAHNVSFSRIVLNNSCFDVNLDVTINNDMKKSIMNRCDIVFSVNDFYNSWDQNLPVLSVKKAP